ncbi:MAG TPA: hypothetical protein VF463_02790 [Sphingobium sp.]
MTGNRHLLVVGANGVIGAGVTTIPIFYWPYEDHARASAPEHGFAFTLLRPQVLLGSAPGRDEPGAGHSARLKPPTGRSITSPTPTC